jgi:hypothetical protein
MQRATTLLLVLLTALLLAGPAAAAEAPSTNRAAPAAPGAAPQVSGAILQVSGAVPAASGHVHKVSGAVPAASSAAPAAGLPPADEQNRLLGRHAFAVERLRHSIEAVLGPLPAVAATPFFGLAALTAVAMAADTDLVRQSRHPVVRVFADNDLVREAHRYASWPVLLGFLALALITYLANSGKVRGIVGKGLRLIEDASVLMLYSALAGGVLAAAAPAGSAAPAAHAAAVAAAAHPAVLAMGFAQASWEVLTACGLAIGLAAMMISRYALDFLIWLVPVPFIDFCFETLKKLLAIGFILLYVFAPGVAAVLALLLAVGALFASRWALRLLGFAFHIVLRPWIARLDPAFAPRLVEPRLAGSRRPGSRPAGSRRAGSRQAGHPAGEQRLPAEGDSETTAAPPPQLATWAVALAAPGLSKRQGGTLVRDADGIAFVSRSRFGRRRRRPLSGPGRSRELVRTLLWTELRVTSAGPSGASSSSFADGSSSAPGASGAATAPGRSGPPGAASPPGAPGPAGGRVERFAISRTHDLARLAELLDARLYGEPAAGGLRPPWTSKETVTV